MQPLPPKAGSQAGRPTRPKAGGEVPAARLRSLEARSLVTRQSVLWTGGWRCHRIAVAKLTAPEVWSRSTMSTAPNNAGEAAGVVEANAPEVAANAAMPKVSRVRSTAAIPTRWKAGSCPWRQLREIGQLIHVNSDNNGDDNSINI